MHRKRIELVFSIVMCTVLAFMLWEARLWPPRTRLFPWSIGYLVFGLSILKVGLSLRNLLTAPASEPTPKAATLNKDFTQGRTIQIVCWIVGCFLTIWLFGLRFGSLLVTFAFLKGAAKESWKLSITLSVSTYLFFFLLFEFALAVALPSGLIAILLGGHSVDSYFFEWVRNIFYK